MLLENLEVDCRIDYCGIHPVSEKPLLSIRLYVSKENDKKSGISISSDGVDNFDDATYSLNGRFGKWYADRHKGLISIIDILKGSKELERKFNNWLGMKPFVLEKANTIEVKL